SAPGGKSALGWAGARAGGRPGDEGGIAYRRTGLSLRVPRDPVSDERATTFWESKKEVVRCTNGRKPWVAGGSGPASGSEPSRAATWRARVAPLPRLRRVLPRLRGNAVHLSSPEDDFKGGSLGRFRACPAGSVDEVVELSVDGSRAGTSPADEGVAGNELVDSPLSELCNCPSACRLHMSQAEMEDVHCNRE